MNKQFLTLILAIFCVVNMSAQSLPYQNPKLPAAQRADDLLSRLTIHEKVSLMMDTSPAIPRLGIPQFQWWNEALHGIGRNGFATVFPITMAMVVAVKCLGIPVLALGVVGAQHQQNYVGIPGQAFAIFFAAHIRHVGVKPHSGIVLTKVPDLISIPQHFSKQGGVTKFCPSEQGESPCDTVSNASNFNHICTAN